MPEITISDELYRQIEAESSADDINETLWKMLGSYRRTHNPQSDVTEGHSFDDG
jgi:hypothetical protein